LVLATALLPGLAAAGTIGAGERFPSFTVAAWDGASIRSSDLAGRPVVIDFWASWCVVCRQALPALDAMARRLAPRGVVVLAVNVDRDRKAADAWLARHLPGRELRLVHDPDGALLASTGASGMPAVFVVDASGIVRLAESGYAADRVRAIEEAVNALLPAEPD
jgi:thiol-disulfide isomerase/thioredoxin